MMSFYLDLIKQRKVTQLPPVFPIVLYNGDPKWTAPVNISDLIENHELLGEFGVRFKYFKIAENEFKPEDLLQIKNVVSTLFLAENHIDIKILTEQLRLLFRKEDHEAVELLFNWFYYLRTENRFAESDFDQLAKIYRDEGDVNMLLAAVRKEKKEIFTQGKLQRTQEIARAMLVEGATISFIMKVTGLPKEEVEELRNQTN